MMQRQLDRLRFSKEGVKVLHIKQEVEDDKIYQCPLKKPKLEPSTDIQPLKSVAKKLPNGLLLKPVEASVVNKLKFKPVDSNEVECLVRKNRRLKKIERAHL